MKRSTWDKSHLSVQIKEKNVSNGLTKALQSFSSSKYITLQNMTLISLSMITTLQARGMDII